MAQASFAHSRAVTAASSLSEVVASKCLHGCSGIRHSLSSSVEAFGLSSTVDNSYATDRSYVQSKVRALQRRASDDGPKVGKLGSADLPAFQSRAWLSTKVVSDVDESDPLWEQIGAGLRIIYAAGVYLVMALAGQAICHFAGLDKSGGFEMCPDVAMQGLGYAIPPMLALLFILDDEVVKISPAARAIRDVEDEELMTFFVGMSAWQLLFVVAMDAIAEELFFRIAIQQGIAHMFLSDGKFGEPSDGIAALTGVLPFFAPFAHGLAAVLTAALTGSILFVTSFPQDPAYVITRVHRDHSSPREVKKSFAAWYEKRQLRRIYSPLLDSLLALYLGAEWLQTGNILAPIITHIIYTTVVVGNGLRRIHDRREKLRQRTQSFWERETVVAEFQPKVEK
ncbi:hypothetical protein L7F22_053045 [Adiantum nelumboides]|nr:hypothetical protein [Adiantum nelumboides]